MKNMKHDKNLRPGWPLLPVIWLFVLAGCASAEDLQGAAVSGETAWIIPIRGDIEPSMTAFVRREARKAQAQGAEYIVFEIDTFGGRVDSALQITSFIMSIGNAKTVAWVHNSAESMGVSWSAGALIAFSCADIYMANGTSMGAAAPVTVSSGGAEAAGEKTVAALRSQMAALAERNGHPTGIALAMVDLDVELWEVLEEGKTAVYTLEELERLEKDGSRSIERLSVISPKGKLLSLTAGEAYRFGLSRGFADDRQSLLADLGAVGGIEESVPGAADGLIAFLTSGPVQVLLIILGLVMIFLEINSPGFGIPGVVAVIAFLTVFGSGALLGKVGSLEIVFFLAGIGLLAVEIFILPGFGIAGISGVLLIGVSLILSMQDFVVPRFDWEWSLLGRNTVVVIIGIIAAITGIAVIALLGPKIRIFDGLTLKTRIIGTAGGPDPDAEEAGPQFHDAADYARLLGKEGKAVSTLRPSGKAEIEGELFTVEADGSFIEKETALKVVRVYGNRIIVRPA
jgi:membrane-bound serine protease (ClpP class)